MFTEKELAYIKSQHLIRIATVSNERQPDVTPVGYEFDGFFFYIGGRNVSQTRKYRNIKSGNVRVSLVLDDLLSIKPWNPRGIRIYGTADFIERQGYVGSGVYIRIRPEISWSWNIETLQIHKTIHTYENASSPPNAAGK